MSFSVSLAHIIVYSCKAETQTEQNLNILEPEQSLEKINQSLPVPIPDQEVDIPIVIVEDIPSSVLTSETPSQSTVPNKVQKVIIPADSTEVEKLATCTSEIPTQKPKDQSLAQSSTPSPQRILPSRSEHRKNAVPTAASELGVRTSPDKSIGEGKYIYMI